MVWQQFHVHLGDASYAVNPNVGAQLAIFMCAFIRTWMFPKQYYRLRGHRHSTETNESIPVVVPSYTSCFSIDCSGINSTQSMQSMITMCHERLKDHFAIYLCSLTGDLVGELHDNETPSSPGRRSYHGYSLNSLQQQQDAMRSRGYLFDQDVFTDLEVLNDLNEWNWQCHIKDLKERFTANHISYDLNDIRAVVCIPLMIHNPQYNGEFSGEGGVFGVDRGGIYIPHYDEDVTMDDESLSDDNDSEEAFKLGDKKMDHNEDVRDG